MNKNSSPISESSFNCIDHTTTQNPTRPRKCCPHCGSLRISRLTRKGGYTCAKCGVAFQQPIMKETNRVFYGAGPKFIQAEKGAQT